MKVVADFIGTSTLKGHKRNLKKWRDLVITEHHYKNKAHGPGELLFTYDLNLKLLEAMHLFWLTYRNNNWNFKALSVEQLRDERDAWEEYPRNLELKEQQNPYKAIKKVFAKLGPQQYRDSLHEWLYFALCNAPADETLLAGEITAVYENLLKLYSLAWLIHKRQHSNSNKGYAGENIGDAANSGSKDHQEEARSIIIKDINPQPGKAEALEEIKKLIIERLPVVKMIIHLGTRTDPALFYLLILVDDQDKTPEHSISNKIEDNCRYLGNVLTLVHKVSSAVNAINIGSRFWNDVLVKGNIIHQSPDVHFPAKPDMSGEDFAGSPTYNWERWGIQGKQFIAGAVFYQADHKYRLAAFLLHQAVESILKAVIQAVLGYRISIHNIGRMLKISELFTEALSSVFELKTLEGKQLFELLQNAYSEARYRDAFDPTKEEIAIAVKRIKNLYSVAERVFNLAEADRLTDGS
ncbi:HEPN domain-containing protein [Mucilaginibacter gynuensis]